MKRTLSLGDQIVQGLQEFVEALESGDQDRLRRFNYHEVKLNLVTTSYDGQLVKETRTSLGASQAVFAAFLGVSVKTVSSWEQDKSLPSAMAGRFMDEIRFDPKYWQKRLQSVAKARKQKYPAPHKVDG